MNPIQIFERLNSKKIDAFNAIEENEKKVERLGRQIEIYEEARTVFTSVLEKIQEETKARIEGLVTLAIQSVFESEDIFFKIKFEQKNNRVYAVPLIVENDQEYEPEEDMGGGIIDVISVALRIILWHMETPRKRNILILDEPFRFTGKLVPKAGEMLKYIAKNLNLQVVMVSHDDDLIEICDRVYIIKKINKTSEVKLVKSGIKRRKRSANHLC